MADSNTGAGDVVISRAFTEKITNEVQDIVPLLAPVILVPGNNASYWVATENIIHEEESGYNPLTAQSRDAPSRRLNRGLEERVLDVEKTFWHEFVNDVTEWEVLNNTGNSLIEAANLNLRAFFRDLWEYRISKFYQDASNYGESGVALNLGATADPETVLTALEARIRQVRPSNSTADGFGVTIAAGADVRAALLRILKPYYAPDTPFFSYTQLLQSLSTTFGADVKMYSSESQYKANITQGKQAGKDQKLPMWDPAHLSITGVSSNPIANPSFAHTALHEKFGPGLAANLYTEYTHDPRGTKIYVESYYKVNQGERSRGILFAPTFPSS